jgi:polar amino acid transport system permease protein
MTSLETFYDYFFTYGGYKDYFTGLKNTAIIAVFGLLIGFLIGCLISTVKIVPEKNIPLIIAEKLCDVYIAIFRGTPMTVQLLLLHFAVFPAVGLNISSVAEAVIIFGLNSGAYMAEIIRSGINSIDGGQMEAGRSLGLGFVPTMLFIVLPQAIKNILPTLGNEFIALIKETSVVSFIAVVDVTKALKSIGDSTLEYFVPYIVLAITYLIIVLVITWLIKLMETRLQKNER